MLFSKFHNYTKDKLCEYTHMYICIRISILHFNSNGMTLFIVTQWFFFIKYVFLHSFH